MASFYGVFHGPVGLKAIAQRVHLNAVTLADALRAAGDDRKAAVQIDLVHSSLFPPPESSGQSAAPQ